MITTLLALLLPRPCYICGRRTRRWHPVCEDHRGQGYHSGDINP